MSGRILQELLTSGEYDEFEDIITVEGEFIEFDEAGYAIRQVILGTSPSHLIKAMRNISDYKKVPEVFCENDIDFYLDGLELVSIVPLCFLRIAFTINKYELYVGGQGVHRYYLLCNTRMNGRIEETWERWRERVHYIKTDPYHYIRNMLDEHNLPYSDDLAKLELEERQEKMILESINVKLANRDPDKISFAENRTYDRTYGRKDTGDFLRDSSVNEDRDHKVQTGKHKKKRRGKKRIFSWKFLYVKRRR